MRFMMMIKAPNNQETGAPNPDLLAEMARFTSEMTKAGVLLLSEGLEPSSKGARIRVSSGRLTVIDGPFTEAKELIGGFAIIQAKSKEEAIELGTRFMDLHTKVLGPSYTGECEIRQLYGLAD